MADTDTHASTTTNNDPPESHPDSNGADAVSPDDTTEAGALAEVNNTTTTTQAPTTKDEPNGDHSAPADTPQSPTDEEILEAMRDIFSTLDLSEITLRVLMGLLEKKFSKDLTSRKLYVKEHIPILLAEQQSGDAEAVKEEGEGGDAEEESEELVIINENGDEEKGSQETLNLSKEDIEVQRLLMEQIKHGTGRVTRGKASGRAPPKPFKSKAKKRKSTDNEEEKQEEEEEAEGEEPKKKKKKATSRANRPKNLSPALAEFLGENQMTRPDVVKKLHEYIKANNLQNPKDKRKILFDDKLQVVFKRKTTDYFQLNTLLTKHLTDPGELL